jgi:peptide/nickel transport system ATP-binding protein
MKKLRKDFDSSILLITHDMGIVAELADRVAVMYAGQMVEFAEVKEFFGNTKHPYSQGLLKSIPRLDRSDERLSTIEGFVPNPSDMPSGCRFHPRCPHVMSICKNQEPALEEYSKDHSVSCFLYSRKH